MAWRARRDLRRCGPCLESVVGAGGESGAGGCLGVGGMFGPLWLAGSLGALHASAEETREILSIRDAMDHAVFPVGLSYAGQCS